MTRLSLVLLLLVAAGWREFENEPQLPQTVRPGGLPGTWWEPIMATGPAHQVVVVLHRHDERAGTQEEWRRATHWNLQEPLQAHGIAMLQLDVRKGGAEAVSRAIEWIKEKRGIHPQRVAVLATGDVAELGSGLRGKVATVLSSPPDSVASLARTLDCVVIEGVIDAVERNGRTTLDIARGVSLTVGPDKGGLYLGLRVRPQTVRALAKRAKIRVGRKAIPLPQEGVWGPPGNRIRPPQDRDYEVVIPYERLGSKAGEFIDFAFALDGERFAETTLRIRMAR